MNARPLRPAELTPDARIARAKRIMTEAIGELVEACLAKQIGATEWVDQDASPLGRRRHLELVRTGALKGARDGRRVLVRRAEIDAYLTDRLDGTPAVEDDEDVDGMLRRVMGDGR